METFIVTYIRNYPDCDAVPEEDRTHTAFVLAESFNQAAEKVEKEFKKEFESVWVKAVFRDKNSNIIT